MTQPYSYRNIVAADANTHVIVRRKGDTATPGMLALITINKISAHALGIHDGEASTDALIGTLVASAAVGTYHYYVAYTKGLSVSVPASFVGDVTVAYL